MDQLPTKGRFRLEYRGTECKNCGHPLDLSDRYCPNCAQANSTKKITVRDYWEEYMSGMIAYDSRLFRTLSAMIFRPGKISREFIAGKRMRYANPFRFLLSLAIVYFLLLSTTGDYETMDEINPVKNDQEMAVAEQIVDSVLTSRQVETPALGTFGNLDSWTARHDSIVLSNPAQQYDSVQGLPFWDRASRKFALFNTLIRKKGFSKYQQAADTYALPNTLEDRYVFRMAKSIYKVSRQPGSFVQSLLSSLPFATFFFIPAFTFFIWLVYINKKYTYTDNLIFCFHNQAALFILLIISFLTDLVFGTNTAWIAFLAFAVYLYIAMRNFYGEGRFITLIKYLFVNTIFVILSGFAALALVLGSAFTY